MQNTFTLVQHTCFKYKYVAISVYSVWQNTPSSHQFLYCIELLRKRLLRRWTEIGLIECWLNYAVIWIFDGRWTINTLGTGYLNCLYAYKRKSASPVLNVLTSFSRDKFDNYWRMYLVDKRAYWVSCLFCVSIYLEFIYAHNK
jgi:hypothetical protein